MTLKEYRMSRGLTQRQVSEATGVPLRTLENWEEGKRTPPDYVVNLIIYKLEREKV